MKRYKIGDRVRGAFSHASDGFGTVTALGKMPDGEPMVQVRLDRHRKVVRYPARLVRRSFTVEQALRRVEAILAQDEWDGADDMPEIDDVISNIDPRDRARYRGRK